jgi:hypothetical protein
MLIIIVTVSADCFLLDFLNLFKFRLPLLDGLLGRATSCFFVIAFEQISNFGVS